MSIPRTSAHTDKAPQPYEGLYSQAVIANGVVYCSGIVAIDPETGKLIDGDVKAHTERILQSLSSTLQSAGTSLDQAVKINVYLANMDDFAAMNSVYKKYFVDEVKPCRTCVAVKSLPFGTDVEMECIAVL
ncbi:L-PSP endoribonuclease family protein (B.t1.c1) [Penicillium soppii]|uniref:L-PSP endoribonuclease family protein (B.t1.c1) n=1 Tax=Penicillium soppii TaxID=69789 RepID=UPI0025499EAE|nr:L-PSP endoribonuclease family protein (B.t1.c1) [Penicillium soppii]KAJ5874511.1 L-PSP endoribonuclease family protein (B.t1.c1) [Penicillium soppii]